MSSKLFGQNGELWNRDRLSDFSICGYEFGGNRNNWITTKQSVNIKTDYGAVGDGKTDDTAAFTACFAKVLPYTEIYIPPGTYLITKQATTDPVNPRVLVLSTPYISIRGDDPATTTIYFQYSWSQITGKYATDMWSFGPFLFSVEGTNASTQWSKILEEMPRGATTAHLSDVTIYNPGDWIRFTGYDGPMLPGCDHGQLTVDLYGATNVPIQPTQNSTRISFDSVVVSVQKLTPTGKEGYVTFNRPIPFSLKFIYNIGAAKFTPSVHHVGIQNITFSCDPSVKYAGHFASRGYNLLGWTNIYHGFVKNVNFLNGEYGFQANGCNYCTFNAITVDSKRATAVGAVGHHALACLFQSSSNLYSMCYVAAHYFHDYSLNNSSNGNAFVYCRGINANIDSHGGAPFDNLFDNFDFGKGTNCFVSGGNTDAGCCHANLQTLWNCQCSTSKTPYGPLKLGITNPSSVGMPHGFSLKSNFIIRGTSVEPQVFDVPDGTVIEWFSGGVVPKVLYNAQMALRYP